MKKICLVALSFVTIISAEAQTIKAKLDAAIRQLEKDSQLKHGLIGFSVIDAATGKPVYERNGEIGLAPASTQKIFISIAAFELLGKEYRYKTNFFGTVGELNKNETFTLYIGSSGDPTLGSWRFENTKEEKIFDEIFDGLAKNRITNSWDGIVFLRDKFETQSIPSGWIWEDIANYYGAGHYSFNWTENQYDLILTPGKKIGDPVAIKKTNPSIVINGWFLIDEFINELKTAAKGTGDNAFIYFEPKTRGMYVRGTIPCCVDSFVISGSLNGGWIFHDRMWGRLRLKKLIRNGADLRYLVLPIPSKSIPLYEHLSPPLDSINYYFLKRSINLYGEALIRTISKEKADTGSTTKGLELVKEFFDKAGIEKSAIDIIDGSGLSPQNRLTANSLTKALKYAKTRPWFSSFYYALPEINGMKMKSGSIGGVRSYAGYQGKYIFSIIVNGYNGSSSEMNKKLLKILDYLK